MGSGAFSFVLSKEDPMAQRIREVMTSNPLTAAPQTPVAADPGG